MPLVVAIGACVAALAGLALAMRAGATADVDRVVIMALRTGGDPSRPIGPAWLQEAGRDVTALGSYAVLVFLVAALVGYLWLRSDRASAVLLSACVVGGMAVSTMLKVAIDRPRPDLPHAARVFTASFPSGHATISSITYLTLAALVARSEMDRRIRIYVVGLAIFLTMSVGFSRLYLGLHYPDDVLAGWLTGAAWALSCWMIALRLER